jgi:hypothetical protein
MMKRLRVCCTRTMLLGTISVELSLCGKDPVHTAPAEQPPSIRQARRFCRTEDGRNWPALWAQLWRTAFKLLDAEAGDRVAQADRSYCAIEAAIVREDCDMLELAKRGRYLQTLSYSKPSQI